jgi:hypothetical protein
MRGRVMATIVHTRREGIPFQKVFICLVIAIVALGLAFAKKYFQGQTFSNKPVNAIIHVHAALMGLWVVMLIGQA